MELVRSPYSMGTSAALAGIGEYITTGVVAHRHRSGQRRRTLVRVFGEAQRRQCADIERAKAL